MSESYVINATGKSRGRNGSNQQLSYFLRKTRVIAFTNALILSKYVYAVLFVMVY